jgi:hypothetical protein
MQLSRRFSKTGVFHRGIEREQGLEGRHVVHTEVLLLHAGFLIVCSVRPSARTFAH